MFVELNMCGLEVTVCTTSFIDTLHANCYFLSYPHFLLLVKFYFIVILNPLSAWHSGEVIRKGFVSFEFMRSVFNLAEQRSYFSTEHYTSSGHKNLLAPLHISYHSLSRGTGTYGDMRKLSKRSFKAAFFICHLLCSKGE